MWGQMRRVRNVEVAAVSVLVLILGSCQEIQISKIEKEKEEPETMIYFQDLD